MTVWSKQHRAVLQTLRETGRYVASRAFIEADMPDYRELVIEAYDWLARRAAQIVPPPPDAPYPVWVSLKREATMLPHPDTVILELDIDERAIIKVSIVKWGMILNYAYIPQSEADAARHSALLDAYGVSDAKAYMSQFYPDIKREIVNSWDRLFDDSVVIGNTDAYGIVWELREEWLVNAQ